MSPERVPSEYQNRHEKKISIESYTGVASDVMALDVKVADGFMSSADMRRDIAVVRKTEDRSREYDQLGFVKISKLFQLPVINNPWKGDHLLQVKKESGVWIVAVNDQELADKASRTGDRKTFEDRFLKSFQDEFQRGLKNCLLREKILNSENYDYAFFMGMFNLLSGSSDFTQLINALAKNPSDFPTALAELSSICFYDVFNNLLLYATVRMEAKRNGIKNDKQDFFWDINFDEPFIRHNYLEFVFPIVPLDRMIRGLLYLGKNRNQFLAIDK